MRLADLLLSDHRRATKLGIALSLLVMGFAGARLLGPLHYPSIEECQLRPERNHGREVLVHFATVTRVASDHFEIETANTRSIVEGMPGDLRQGDGVTLVATFDRRNVLRLDGTGRWRRPVSVEWMTLTGWLADAAGTRSLGMRTLMNLVSALVLAGLGLRFIRLFRGRLAVPAFSAREPEPPRPGAGAPREAENSKIQAFTDSKPAGDR